MSHNSCLKFNGTSELDFTRGLIIVRTSDLLIVTSDTIGTIPVIIRVRIGIKVGLSGCSENAGYTALIQYIVNHRI